MKIINLSSVPLVKVFGVFFILSIPFFDVPRVGIPGIPLVFYFFIAFSFFYLLSGKIRLPYIPLFVFSSFIIVYSISYIFNYYNLDVRGINHIVLYILSFLMFYVGFIWALDALGEKLIKKLILVGLIIIAVIGTIEVLYFYLYGWASYANFLNHGQNVGVFAGVFPRMRSLFNEPSHLALYVMGAGVIVWNTNIYVKALISYILFWTFSTSAAIGIFISTLLYIFWKSFFNQRISYKISLIILMSIIAISHQYIINSPLFFKLFGLFSADSTDSIRLLSYLNSLEYIDLSPLYGLGPAYYYNYSSYGLFNLYLQLYIEAGLVGLLLFVIFYLYHATSITSHYYYFIPFFALFLQYVGMNHYYVPGFWIMLAYLYYKQKGNYNFESVTCNHRLK